MNKNFEKNEEEQVSGGWFGTSSRENDSNKITKQQYKSIGIKWTSNFFGSDTYVFERNVVFKSSKNVPDLEYTVGDSVKQSTAETLYKNVEDKFRTVIFK